MIKAETNPIGIDVDKFASTMRKSSVRAKMVDYLDKWRGCKVILGIDRLDYIKGVPQKLLAFEHFLKTHPEWRDKVVLVQIAIPSRTDVLEYQNLRSLVHQLVGRINGEFGSLGQTPVNWLDQSIPFDNMCALMAISDVCFVTSLRDGMNLVSFEYIACQVKHKDKSWPGHDRGCGVLLLSELAGAAQCLGAGAVIVNPYDCEDCVSALEKCLTMDGEDRAAMTSYAESYVNRYTAQHWATTFVDSLDAITSDEARAAVRADNLFPTPLDTDGALVAMV